jgi:uncharacterized protein (TIGR02646 family)
VIFVERGPLPPSLDGPGSAGGKERSDAVAFYDARANRERNFPFKAYKADDVGAALRAMFGDKCAYCEAPYPAVAPPDAEHYRPKGRVRLGSGRYHLPGYYWLAAEWTNLLPTCIHCNRTHRHPFAGGEATMGKWDYFPLADEATRATAPGEEARERPLLLDPTRDTPEQHLEFGEEGAIRATTADGVESSRGRRTIEVIGLHRKGLTDARAKHLKYVDREIDEFERAIRNAERYPADPSFQADLDRAFEDLLDLLEPTEPFTAMTRQRLRSLLVELDIG